MNPKITILKWYIWAKSNSSAQILGKLQLALRQEACDATNPIGCRVRQSSVVVAKVAPRSLAARFGLQPGDILLEVNGEGVDSTKSLVAIAGEDYRGWQFDIERGRRRLTQVVR